MANRGELSWAGLAAMAARLATVSSKTLRSCTVKELTCAPLYPRTVRSQASEEFCCLVLKTRSAVSSATTKVRGKLRTLKP